MKKIRTLGILWVLFIAVTGRAETPPEPVHLNVSNALAWDAVVKSMDLPAMTNSVLFTFLLTNRSAENVTIFSTDTSCDCTVAETVQKLPWQIAPGEGGTMTVRVNTKGRYGDQEKYVAVFTSLGTQMLTVHMKIPLSPAPFNVSVRQQDVMAAKADRQAVFGGHCAACHNWPAKNTIGEGLFQAACGICHISDKRADFVPDLFELKHPNTPEYWRGVITHGKTGTLMPAFASSEGGILDTNQIESLVDYLVNNVQSKAFPPPQPTDYLLQH